MSDYSLALGPIFALRAMASQKLFAFDENNRLVANADDPRSAIQFTVQSQGGDLIKLSSFHPEIGIGGEWIDICPTNENYPHFAPCSDSDNIIRPAKFRKVCYSHWHGVPHHTSYLELDCDVFGLEYSTTNHLLTVAAKGGNLLPRNREGLLTADGDWGLRELGINYYHKTFMFVDPTRSEDEPEQWFVWIFFPNYQL